VKQITSGLFSLSMVRRNALPLAGLVTGTGRNKLREQAMGQQLQGWRSADGGKLWLSKLIDTMEQMARPELRSQPCDRLVLATLRAQLSRPASPYPRDGSRFSLHN
jgi:hypothetical protein